MSKAKDGVQVVCRVSRWTSIHSGSPTTWTRSSATAGKAMLTVLVDIHRPLLLVWMPISTTISAQRYCDTLQNLLWAIKHKRHGKLSRGVLILQDNACPHAGHATRDTLRRFGWGVMDNPPPPKNPRSHHL
jgi:hypothetical protein